MKLERFDISYIDQEYIILFCKNGENLALVLNDKKWKFLHKIICCGDLLESPRGGDSNRLPQHMILWRTNGNYAKKIS